ncbi:MAG TPA: aminotransferase [Peptococcaceae bacterium]|nr:MAG: Serine--glyoxylate transaminase [Clostridia bacterium 41_269]HBT19779.1 aminotransferase [Peptococcaceae bacterium]
MWEKQILLLPGPTQVPPRVMRAMAAQQINHRGPEAKELLFEITEGVKKVFQTTNDVFILTASGTGGMEAAVSNIICPGDKVLIVSNGSFGERFVQICRAFGADVEVIEYEWGKPINPDDVAFHLEKDKGHLIKAVFLQHNETSTGVLNDVKAVSEARGNHPALLVVDAISGLAAADLQVDNWDLDIVISGSQKAFMIPPGLTALSVSERAWEMVEKATASRFYFDLRLAKKFYEKGQTPFTPALSLMFGLKESLKIILEEGLENIFKRHEMYKNMVWAAAEALNLEMLAPRWAASPAVSAIKVPPGLSDKDIVNRLLEDYNVVIAKGQGKLSGKIIRIGHLGYVDGLDLLAGITALEITLYRLGYDIEIGAGVHAAEEVLRRGG